MTLKGGPDYLVEEDSDDYGAMSSEEEEDPLLAGNGMLGEEEASEEDDFEKEMDAEIRQSMSISLPEKKKEKAPKAERFYDDVYFNSSDEDDSGNTRKVDKKVKTNEELFYDPSLDEKDEKWVQKKRKNYLRPGSDKKGETSDPKPATSATLSCPSCMTILCRDCQQHDNYDHQFRAMFVFNCLVVSGETLTYKIKEKKKKRRRGKEKQEEVEEGKEGDGELYNPVKCNACQTKVGVYDKEEIYHFFNVLAT